MYFSRDIAFAALLFHRREKQKPSIYKHVRMYTSLSTFCILKKKNKYWRLQAGCLQVRCCFMLRYFTEVLLFNTIMQFYLSFKQLLFFFR